MMRTIEILDTHTGGEPTRIVIRGGPDLGSGSMAERAENLANCDWLRRALILEPRGGDWMVGALLQEPVDAGRAAGVIFFNNVGTLGMCVHGTIGVVETLVHMGKLTTGKYLLETPVGIVPVERLANGRVSVTNVRSYRTEKSVAVKLPQGRVVHGDVA